VGARNRTANRRNPNSKHSDGVTLCDAVWNWPTPAARDHKVENSPDHLTNGTGRLHLDQLPNAVAFLFSRPARETQTHGPMSCEWRPISRRLFRSAMSSVSRTTVRRWLRAGSWRKRRLNPAFVGWLMGWPHGHALCDCSETEFARYRLAMRGALSRLPMDCGPWIWKPPGETKTEQLEMF